MGTFSRILAAAFGALLLALAADVHAIVVTVPCDRDNTLFEDAEGDTSSGAGTSLYAGTNGQGRVRRAVLRFAVAGAVPPGSRIDSVAVTLHVASAPDTVARSFRLHRVVRDWGEGASAAGGGSGTTAAPGDATWLHAFHPVTSWTAAGGDFDVPASAARDVGDVGEWTWEGDGLVRDVTSWLADPGSNFGWLLFCGDEAISRSVRRFDAREAAEPASRPFLRIVLSDAIPALPATWGRVKAAYHGGAR